MKILYVLPYFNPKRGGDVNFCSNLANEFVKRGHEVTILTTDFELDPDYIKFMEKTGVNVIIIKYLLNFGLFIYSPSIKGWLEKNIKYYNVVHLHTFRSYQNVIVQKIASKYKVHYIVQAHGSVLPFFQKIFLKKLFDYKWGYNILNNSTKVVACTNEESKQYMKMNVKKNQIAVIPNAIDFTQFGKISKGVFRKKYSIDQSEKIILYLGRINKIKGIDLLIDSFRKLNIDTNQFKLVLIGPDDGFLNDIKTQIEAIGENIIYLGPLYGNEKYEAYADADVYVLPSVYDNFPITVLESLASATPVIVTNRCGIVDLVKKVGIVADYDPISLSEAIINILSDEKLRFTLGEKSRNFIKKNFTFEIIGKQFEDLYNDI